MLTCQWGPYQERAAGRAPVPEFGGANEEAVLVEVCIAVLYCVLLLVSSGVKSGCVQRYEVIGSIRNFTEIREIHCTKETKSSLSSFAEKVLL